MLLSESLTLFTSGADQRLNVYDASTVSNGSLPLAGAHMLDVADVMALDALRVSEKEAAEEEYLVAVAGLGLQTVRIRVRRCPPQ